MLTKPCKHKKTTYVSEGEFDGLFADTPVVAYAATLCDKCGAIIEDWHPVSTAEEC